MGGTLTHRDPAMGDDSPGIAPPSPTRPSESMNDPLPASRSDSGLDRRLSVAPMMDWTDRHYRFFARLLSRHTLLYTEMVTTGALLRGDTARFLRHDPAEHPVALQLGGSDPADMAHCARLGADAGFAEININVGCPSDRVQNGRFGACLMAEPAVVADCVAAMKAAVPVPVTVKTRIGIDDQDSFDELLAFSRAVVDAGCDVLVVHARKAWLQGLSPRENRDVPPLRYDVVLRLKQHFPGLPVVINGGIQTLEQARGFLDRLDGAMIGRAAYQSPWLLADADRIIYGDETSPPTPHEVLDALLPYVERQLAEGVPLNSISRHMLGLFHGRPGARRWRRTLSEQAHRPGAGIEVLREAARQVD